MSKTKIAISGIGAVGGYYGGLLAARYKDSKEIDIYFISRGENLEEIRENGIEVKNTFLTIKAKPTLATDNPAEIGPVDYLFCCTKSYDLEDNIAQLAPVIGPKASLTVPVTLRSCCVDAMIGDEVSLVSTMWRSLIVYFKPVFIAIASKTS